MAKKLRVEVEADTAKAKRKLQELADGTAGDAGGNAVSSSADRAAKALDRAAKNVKGLGDEASASSASMTRLVRSFAGIGASMAASYAANHMDPGVGKTSMGYMSSILSGASTGAMVGSAIPGVGTVAGAVVGGGVGAVKQFADNSQMEEDWFKDFHKNEQTLKENRVWADMLEELTTVKTNFKGLSGLDELKAQLAEVDAASKRTSDAIEQLKNTEKAQLEEIRSLETRDGLTAEERVSRATEEATALATTRQKLAQLEGAEKRFAGMREALGDQIEEYRPRPEFRVSDDAVDALSRIGGNFGGGDLARDQLRTQQEMAATLKSIDQKATNGGGIWQ